MKTWFVTVMTWLLILPLSAQSNDNVVINGIVMDEKGETLPGAVVMVKEHKNLGRVTDAFGKFLLKDVPLPATLIVSYMDSYKTKTIVLENQEYLVVTLEPIVTEPQPTASVVKSETTKSQSTASTSKHMTFLGLPLGGNPQRFEKDLRAKGFTDGNGWDMSGNSIFLRGNVYGRTMEVCISVVGGVVKGVSATDMIEGTSAAKRWYTNTKQRITQMYGKGRETYAENYEIKLPYGTASCGYGMFDSGLYEVGLHIIEN